MTAPSQAEMITNELLVKVSHFDPETSRLLGLRLSALLDALESTSRALSEKEGELAEARELIAAMQGNDEDIKEAIARAGFTPDIWIVHALDQACEQWAHFAESAETATRQRDEALAALKASEEREAGLLAALGPFALAARDCDVEDDIRIGIVKPDQDIWQSPVAMSITFAHVANALQVREDCKARLADATKKDPGTEQREAGL